MSFDFLTLIYALSICYSALLLIFTIGIFRLRPPGKSKEQCISVIIAARNEAANLPALVSALHSQKYPTGKFEVIIIDDRSTDETFSIMESLAKEHFWLRIARQTAENPLMVGKKGALALGISLAKHEILAFTDADCQPLGNWLRQISCLMTPDTDFLCGYSPLTGSSSLFNLLKNLERSSIFAVIAGSFGLGWSITSVARSQVYRKSCYLKMGGFSGIGDQRSGDDDLLLQKMSPIIRRHNFIFDPGATVISNDKTSLNDHVNLETRRASKWKLYPLSIKLLTLFIFIYYLMLIYLLAALLTGNISLLSFCFIHLIKTGAEFILLAVFLYRIKRFKQLIVFPLAEILYIPYYIIFGLKGTFGKYQWKA